MLHNRTLSVPACTVPPAGSVLLCPIQFLRLPAGPLMHLLHSPHGPCAPVSRGCGIARPSIRSRVVASAVKSSGKKGQGGSVVLDDEQQPQAAAVIEDKELHEEASESYLAYAMSVIVGRALPDVRDGLKPVHRRILYAMHELGLSANKPFKKCARIVGEVLGKYHPHGDTAVYDALVRMAQDFSMRHPLVSGHGNFGSLDNDPAAAMRYTECRLQAVASDMLLSDLDQGVVNFIPTFDASQDEPVVLPAKLPNLLINGTQGIAVGIATKIPPHNMQEVVEGLAALIHNPAITVAELRKYIPAPDFPTGNVVVVGDGAEAMYETGNGHVIIRATMVVETDGSGSTSGKQRRQQAAGTRLVISDVPYQTSKAELVESIAKLVEDKTLDGVADVRDESDRTGTRMVVELKPGASPDTVQAALYRHTRLQLRFATNMVALVDGAPKHLNLKQFLQHFIDFKVDVVQRRAAHQKAAAEKRLHLVEGFLTAIQAMDDVVQDIRQSNDTATARSTLMQRHQLSYEQADAVLGLPLRRLTGMEVDELDKEHQDLTTRIQQLEELLSDYNAVLEVVESEAREVANKYGTPRRSVIMQEKDVPDVHDHNTSAASAAAQPVLVFASNKGFLHKVTQQQELEAKAKAKASLGVRAGDGLEHVVVVDAAQQLLLITPEGRAYRLPVSSVPELSTGRSSNSASPAQLLNAQNSISIAAIMPLVTGNADVSSSSSSSSTAVSGAGKKLMDAETNGHVAHEGADISSTAADHLHNSHGTAIETEAGSGEGSDVAWDGPCLVVVTKQGLIKQTPLLPSFNKITKLGVPVIKLKKGDQVAWAGVARPGDNIALVRNDGRLLMFDLTEVRPTAKTAAGIAGLRVGEDQTMAGAAIVPSAVLGSQEASLLLVSARGRGKRVALSQVALGARGQAGLTAMSVVNARKPDSIMALKLVCGHTRDDGGHINGDGRCAFVHTQAGELVLSAQDGGMARVPIADVPEGEFSAAGAMLLPASKQADASTVTGVCVVPWSSAA